MVKMHLQLQSLKKIRPSYCLYLSKKSSHTRTNKKNGYFRSKIVKVIAVLCTSLLSISCSSSNTAPVTDRGVYQRTTQNLPPSNIPRPPTYQGQATPLEERNLNVQGVDGFQRPAAPNQSGNPATAHDLSTVDGQLSAAEDYIQAQDYFNAEQQAKRISTFRLSNRQRDRLNIVNAYIQFQRQDYQKTLETIEPLIGNLIPNTDPNNRKVSYIAKPDLALTSQQVDALLLGSFSFQKIGNYDSAIAALIRRESALVGEAKSETTRYIWQVIDTLSPTQRQQLIQTTENTLVRNRVEQSLNGEVVQNQVAPQQFAQFRTKPTAQQQRPLQTASSNWNSSSPKNIAVLLPLTSKFNKAAQALLDGIKYQNEQNGSAFRPQIQVYDIGQSPFQAQQFYNAAINSGADFVIGPLGKEYANQVANVSGQRAPTILLGGDYNVGGSTVRFTMSPESQGIQIAKRARQDGHITAAILAPSTATNQRTISAFRDYWLQTGGKISSVVNYNKSQFDHSPQLKQLFDIGSSESRYRQLSNTLSFKPKFNPYQRNDIDFVFMLADNDSGRIVRPQINFFSNSKIPVYSTSNIFNGVPNKTDNIDLDNTLFPIMPWVYKSKDSSAYGGQLNELFAMGADAYEVAGNYQSLRSNSGLAINANTGQVSINSNSEVYTQPLWAKFVNGEPTLVETLGIDVSPTTNFSGVRTGPRNYGSTGSTRSSTGKGVYNDKTWDSGQSRRKTSP